MKLTKTFCLCLFLAVSCTFLSCSNKNAQKEKDLTLFKNFMNYVETDYSKFTEADWVKADTSYDKFCRKFDGEYHNLLNDAQKDSISNYKGKYEGIKIKYQAEKTYNAAKEIIKDVSNQLDGFMKALK